MSVESLCPASGMEITADFHQDCCKAQNNTIHQVKRSFQQLLPTKCCACFGSMHAYPKLTIGGQTCEKTE